MGMRAGGVRQRRDSDAATMQGAHAGKKDNLPAVPFQNDAPRETLVTSPLPGTASWKLEGEGGKDLFKNAIGALEAATKSATVVMST